MLSLSSRSSLCESTFRQCDGEGFQHSKTRPRAPEDGFVVVCLTMIGVVERVRGECHFIVVL